MAIGRKIVNLRKKYNFTQEKLAEKIGVSRQTLSNWESDITSPDLVQASNLSKILKISLDELVDNNLEIECKSHLENQIFDNIIGKTCYLTLTEDFLDSLDATTPVEVLSVNEDFLKVKYLKSKQTKIKLIDMDLIVAIKVLEGVDK